MTQNPDKDTLIALFNQKRAYSAGETNDDPSRGHVSPIPHLITRDGDGNERFFIKSSDGEFKEITTILKTEMDASENLRTVVKKYALDGSYEGRHIIDYSENREAYTVTYLDADGNQTGQEAYELKIIEGHGETDFEYVKVQWSPREPDPVPGLLWRDSPMA